MKNLRMILGITFFTGGLGLIIIINLTPMPNFWLNLLAKIVGFLFLWLSFEYFTPRERDNY